MIVVLLNLRLPPKGINRPYVDILRSVFFRFAEASSLISPIYIKINAMRIKKQRFFLSCLERSFLRLLFSPLGVVYELRRFELKQSVSQ